MDENIVLNAVKRGLPKLVTTTSTSLASTTQTATDVTTSGASVVNSSSASGSSIIKSISLLDSSSFLSSTSAEVTPTITPPSPEGNPHILQMVDIPPRGTVFIAVGACVGAIFVAILIWWAISTYISHRNTKHNGQNIYNDNGNVINSGSYDGRFGHRQQNSLVSQFTSSTYSDNNSSNFEKDEEKVNSSERISTTRSLFNLTRNTTREPFLDDISFDYNEPEQETFNVIQNDSFMYNNNRSSLFISPTLEVSQQQQARNGTLIDTSNIYNGDDFSMMSTDSLVIDNDINKPRRAASPERKKKVREDIHYHMRNKSSLGLGANDSLPSSPTKNNSQRHKKTPSMFLDDMLTDDI
ncbi:hypothetical protein C6P45_005274 [Maudiozyma exigua]|uniref:Vacuolar membrane protein n=1 Tax=Maudiozyma exigua TaxID=34358 RepID=A0A9P6W8Z1_MAUEX|nr:hypothetical protein C6P45_005274 [Kazachstania exigua]